MQRVKAEKDACSINGEYLRKCSQCRQPFAKGEKICSSCSGTVPDQRKAVDTYITSSVGYRLVAGFRLLRDSGI